MDYGFQNSNKRKASIIRFRTKMIELVGAAELPQTTSGANGGDTGDQTTLS